ncbi:MAG: TetR/AcrR family transcriptional regulator [Firmicutes bacterium]|nr:TetR/AcrR family transcriptional regulator [Bacillota bacterium]
MPKDTFFNLPEEKRNRIIDAAITVFSTIHYKKVTIDSIVNSAEIPKGSFYQYFENKDDLYKYIISGIGDRKKKALDQMEKMKEQLNFRDYVIQLLEEAEKFEKKDLKLVALKDKFINECSQEIRKEVLKNEVPKSYKLLEEAITSYIEKGELRKDLDVKTAAYMITSCVIGLEYYNFKKGQTIRDLMAEILEVLVKGMK